MLVNHLRDRISIFRHKREYTRLHDLFRFYILLLIIWGFYRTLFRFPDWIEELILKPLIFVVPVIVKIKAEGKNWKERLEGVGITWKNLFAALAFGLSLGVFYLFVGRMGEFFRFGGTVGNPYGSPLGNPLLIIVLAFATAFSEELVFMGYLLPRLQKEWKDEWKSTTAVAVMFAVIHMPILIFGFRFPISLIVGQFLLIFILGFGNSILMLRLKNVAAPVLSHALWGIAVLLFR